MTEYSNKDGFISLNILIQFSKLQSKVNISIIDEESEINLNKTNISQIVINEGSVDLKLKNMTVTLTEINQIKSIQSYDTSDLKEDIVKLKSILTEHPIEQTKVIKQLIEDVENIEDVFIF